ncbi:ABC transporter permease [Bacillus cytotoxicus]|uniref:ABC transporter permease n=3 Tax=unclassified Bacillus cereus group TaxID=2750818 RepID=UPI001F5ACC12|nr:ABC transporter permease [Bacillus cereus group sp. BfR-BA-01431]EMA6342731.1 ABC transporter permease [Bacillus cytotoxicus]
MLNLMRLELIKFKLWPIIRGALIAICVFSLFVILLMFDGEFTHYDEVFRFIDIFMRGIYIMFGASLIAKFIIQEFQTKTMTVMFMYPINRKKMMMAKMCIIMIVTLLLILISEAIVFCLFYILNLYQPVITESLTLAIVSKNAIMLFVHAVAATGISLIPIYFGMKNYSVRTTFISAIIIMCLVTSSINGEYSLFHIIAIPLALACVGLFIAYRAIRKIEQVDLYK